MLRIYHIQREEFLPSAYAMIVSLVVVIIAVLLFTDMGGLAATLVTVAFLSFFFLYLLRLLHVIDKPFKVGHERTDDDVSLFLLNEFVVQVEASTKGTVSDDEVEAQADEVEIYLTEVEHEEAEEAEEAEQVQEAEQVERAERA